MPQPLTFTIGRASPPDLSQLPAIEIASGTLFATIPLLADLGSGPPSQTTESLAASIASGGTVLIARSVPAHDADKSAPGAPLGFLSAAVVDGILFIEELSVATCAQRQGIGAALIAALKNAAVARGGRKLQNGQTAIMSLTTYRCVPWNGPYYARKGFDFTTAEELGPGHVAKWEHEAACGLERGESGAVGERCCMVMYLDREVIGSLID